MLTTSQTPQECRAAAALAFGKRLKALRRERGLKQGELADLASLHVETIRQYERSVIVPTFPVVVALAVVLAVPLEAFLPE